MWFGLVFEITTQNFVKKKYAIQIKAHVVWFLFHTAVNEK